MKKYAIYIAQSNGKDGYYKGHYVLGDSIIVSLDDKIRRAATFPYSVAKSKANVLKYNNVNSRGKRLIQRYEIVEVR